MMFFLMAIPNHFKAIGVCRYSILTIRPFDLSGLVPFGHFSMKLSFVRIASFDVESFITPNLFLSHYQLVSQ